MFSLLIVVLTFLVSGCGQHYIITSKIVTTTTNVAPPEIVETPTYRKDVAKIKTVAVRAPSSCSDRTSDQQRGTAVSNQELLKTKCAVDMAVIERALTKSSYKVISWTVLEREMARNLSALQVADSMGAQMLFQVNSLEKSTRSFGKLSKDEKLEYFYYNSNDDGEMLDEKAFDLDTRDYLKRSFFDSKRNIDEVQVPFVTLDANAINIKDGEAIWFYRWTNSNPSAVDYFQQFFIKCKTSTSCRIEKSKKDDDEEDDDDDDKKTVKRLKNKLKVSKESRYSKTEEQPEDKNAAVHSALLNSVIDNFVSSFSKPQ